MIGPRSQTGAAPEKGSFPLDHFRECDKEAEAYRVCLHQVNNIPKKCKAEAARYLQCRMDNGLMAPQPLEELGFTEENSIEYEKKQAKSAMDNIHNIMKNSRERVRTEFRQKEEEKKGGPRRKAS